jgi:hypothetical protein
LIKETHFLRVFVSMHSLFPTKPRRRRASPPRGSSHESGESPSRYPHKRWTRTCFNFFSQLFGPILVLTLRKEHATVDDSLTRSSAWRGITEPGGLRGLQVQRPYWQIAKPLASEAFEAWSPGLARTQACHSVLDLTTQLEGFRFGVLTVTV